MRPNNRTLFAIGTILALVAAAILMLVIPRRYPFEPGGSRRQGDASVIAFETFGTPGRARVEVA